MVYLNLSSKIEYLTRLLTLDEGGYFEFNSMIEGAVIALSFLCTFLLLMIAFILIVGFKNLFTKKAMFESLKKKKMVNWLFFLDKKIQVFILILFIGIIWLSFYFFFSSNLFSTICCKVLHWLSIKAYCTDEGDSKKSSADRKSRSSAKASSSSTKQEESANKSTKSQAKPETPSSSKASPSSSKGKEKEKSSTPNKKKSSKKEKTRDAVKQTEQVTKTQAFKGAKQSNPSSSSGRPVRAEDLWGDDDDRLVTQLKNAKKFSERGEQAKEDCVDYFPELENAKGASKSQVTEVERGESSQANPPQSKHKHIRHMEGKTASELGANFGRINKDSYLFTDDNKTFLKPSKSE